MGRLRLRSTAVGFLTWAGVVAGLGGAPAADIVRYGIDDEQNISRLPQVVAERHGFFSREGLEVAIVPFASSFRARAAGARPISLREGMANGDVDMARQQFPLLIADVLMDRKSRAVSVAASNPVYYVAARPEIKSFADLKGKTVAITGPRDGITIWTRKLLALHGLGEGDVTLKDIAGSEGRLDCLKSAECAAASLGQPAILGALEAGGRPLGLTNEVGPLLYQVDIANPAWAAAHRDIVVKYIRASMAAIRFIQDRENREEIVKITSALMKEPEDRSRRMLADIWEPKNRVLPQQAAFDMASVKTSIALLGEYGVLKEPLPAPERFVEPSYAEAAGG
jgi:ABC-type nitrate/sulfonate/bicarbonate transport system substrate-binding protein